MQILILSILVYFSLGYAFAVFWSLMYWVFWTQSPDIEATAGNPWDFFLLWVLWPQVLANSQIEIQYETD